jgi:hypothetical protein
MTTETKEPPLFRGEASPYGMYHDRSVIEFWHDTVDQTLAHARTGMVNPPRLQMNFRTPSLAEELSAISPHFSPLGWSSNSQRMVAIDWSPSHNFDMSSNRTLWPMMDGHHDSVEELQSDREQEDTRGEQYGDCEDVPPPQVSASNNFDGSSGGPRRSRKRNRRLEPTVPATPFNSPTIHVPTRSILDRLSEWCVQRLSPAEILQQEPPIGHQKPRLTIEITERALVPICDGPLTALTEV